MISLFDKGGGRRDFSRYVVTIMRTLISAVKRKNILIDYSAGCK